MNVIIKMGIESYDNLTYTARIGCYLLSFIHSALNPFVYGLMSSNFREMILKSCMKGHSGNQHSQNVMASANMNRAGAGVGRRGNNNNNHGRASFIAGPEPSGHHLLGVIKTPNVGGQDNSNTSTKSNVLMKLRLGKSNKTSSVPAERSSLASDSTQIDLIRKMSGGGPSGNQTDMMIPGGNNNTSVVAVVTVAAVVDRQQASSSSCSSFRQEDDLKDGQDVDSCGVQQNSHGNSQC